MDYKAVVVAKGIEPQAVANALAWASITPRVSLHVAADHYAVTLITESPESVRSHAEELKKQLLRASPDVDPTNVTIQMEMPVSDSQLPAPEPEPAGADT